MSFLFPASRWISYSIKNVMVCFQSSFKSLEAPFVLIIFICLYTFTIFLKLYFIEMYCIIINLVFLLSYISYKPPARMIEATPSHVLTY